MIDRSREAIELQPEPQPRVTDKSLIDPAWQAEQEPSEEKKQDQCQEP